MFRPTKPVTPGMKKTLLVNMTSVFCVENIAPVKIKNGGPTKNRTWNYDLEGPVISI